MRPERLQHESDDACLASSAGRYDVCALDAQIAIGPLPAAARDGVELFRARKESSLSRLVVRASEPFEPYVPVRRQLLNLLRLVNKRRKVAGFVPVPHQVLHLLRRIGKPFARGEGRGVAARGECR